MTINTDGYTLIKLEEVAETDPRTLEIKAYEVDLGFEMTTECLQSGFTMGTGTTLADPYTWLATVGQDPTDYYFYQGVSHETWLSPSQFYNRSFAEHNPEMSQMLTKFANVLQDIEASFDASAENVMTISTDPNEQYYNPEIPEAQRDWGSGQTFHIMQQDPDDGTEFPSGTCKLAFFTKTVYVEGTPVTIVYNSGLFDIDTVNTIPGMPCVGQSDYSSDNLVSLAFYTFKMVVADDNIEINGQTREFLLMCVKRPYAGTSSYECRFQVYSLNAFAPVYMVNPPTTNEDETTVTPSGWTGNWDYSSDEDTVLPITGHNFANRWAHGLRTYYISDNIVNALMSAVWDQTLTQTVELAIDAIINRTNTDFLKGMVFLHKVPVTLTTSGSQNLVVLGTDLSEHFSNLSSVPVLKEQTVQITSTILEVPSTYKKTFMDLNHAGAYVRLPFIGNVPIDIKHIRNGGIYVNYNIDVLTGNLVAQIYAKTAKISAEYAPKYILIYQGSGNCAIPIPFSGNSEGGFKQLGAVAGIANSAVSSLVGTVGNAAMGNALSSVNSIIGGASSISQQIFQSNNTAEYNYVTSEAASLTNLAVKLVIYGDVPVIPEKQQSILGFSARSTGKVNNYKDTGIVVGVVHADTIESATEAEKREIEAMFAGGVIV